MMPEKSVSSKKKPMRLLNLVPLCLLIFSCSKKDKSTAPYIGYLMIDSAITVKTVAVGENIVSRVRLAIPEMSGETTFLGFEIIESPAKNFSIRAKALHKPWDQQISFPVYETFDTTATITTKAAGTHILNFYNSMSLLKSDTVQVY